MKPENVFIHPDWISWPQTRVLMGVLCNSYDFRRDSFFVGGCVRNAILGIEAKDIDIATIYTPDLVKEKLNKENIKTIDTGIKHGTITAVIDKKKFEITTLRKDVKTDGRHAVVHFTNSWEEDAKRRDFTINTLLADINGQVFDPLGQGLDDLQKGRIVFVGDAQDRIKEDYLRIFRFFRFYGLYGAGGPDVEAVSACKTYACGIKNLSKERIGQEFFKILSLRNVADILSLMFSCGLMDDVAPKFDSTSMKLFTDRQCALECVDIYARYLLLTGFDVARSKNYLVFDNISKKHMFDILESCSFLKEVNAKNIRASIYWYGNSATIQAYLLKTLSSRSDVCSDIVDIARYWRAPEFPITGQMLLEQNYVNGPALGNTLKSLEKAWVDSDFEVIPKI